MKLRSIDRPDKIRSGYGGIQLERAQLSDGTFGYNLYNHTGGYVGWYVPDCRYGEYDRSVVNTQEARELEMIQDLTSHCYTTHNKDKVTLRYKDDTLTEISGSGSEHLAVYNKAVQNAETIEGTNRFLRQHGFEEMIKD